MNPDRTRTAVPPMPEVPVIPPRREVPTIPAYVPPHPVEPNPVVAKCGACGIEIRAVMGYVCTRPDCGVFGPSRGTL